MGQPEHVNKEAGALLAGLSGSVGEPLKVSLTNISQPVLLLLRSTSILHLLPNKGIYECLGINELEKMIKQISDLDSLHDFF